MWRIQGSSETGLDSGTQFRMSCPYTSQQNGRDARNHRQVVEFGLTPPALAKMPLSFWWETFATAIFLTIRTQEAVKKISQIHPAAAQDMRIINLQSSIERSHNNLNNADDESPDTEERNNQESVNTQKNVH